MLPTCAQERDLYVETTFSELADWLSAPCTGTLMNQNLTAPERTAAVGRIVLQSSLAPPGTLQSSIPGAVIAPAPTSKRPNMRMIRCGGFNNNNNNTNSSNNNNNPFTLMRHAST
eukprot:8356434-Pyramimonas_sp.AAC.1